MSANRKQSAVLRLLRGEDLELVSRELSVTAAELSAWRDAFLVGGEAALKTRPREIGIWLDRFSQAVNGGAIDGA